MSFCNKNRVALAMTTALLAVGVHAASDLPPPPPGPFVDFAEPVVAGATGATATATTSITVEAIQQPAATAPATALAPVTQAVTDMSDLPPPPPGPTFGMEPARQTAAGPRMPVAPVAAQGLLDMPALPTMPAAPASPTTQMPAIPDALTAQAAPQDAPATSLEMTAPTTELAVAPSTSEPEAKPETGIEVVIEDDEQVVAMNSEEQEAEEEPEEKEQATQPQRHPQQGRDPARHGGHQPETDMDMDSEDDEQAEMMDGEGHEAWDSEDKPRRRPYSRDRDYPDYGQRGGHRSRDRDWDDGYSEERADHGYGRHYRGHYGMQMPPMPPMSPMMPPQPYYAPQPPAMMQYWYVVPVTSQNAQPAPGGIPVIMMPPAGQRGMGWPHGGHRGNPHNKGNKALPGCEMEHTAQPAKPETGAPAAQNGLDLQVPQAAPQPLKP